MRRFRRLAVRSFVTMPKIPEKSVSQILCRRGMERLNWMVIMIIIFTCVQGNWGELWWCSFLWHFWGKIAAILEASLFWIWIFNATKTLSQNHLVVRQHHQYHLPKMSLVQNEEFLKVIIDDKNTFTIFGEEHWMWRLLFAGTTRMEMGEWQRPSSSESCCEPGEDADW